MFLSVNSYFDDNVKFIVFELVNGLCIFGVMLFGEYVFFISKDELMKVVEGELVVKLFGVEEFMLFKMGSEFNVVVN